MSLPHRNCPPAGAPVFLNINEQVSNVNSASVMSHNGTFAPVLAPLFSSIYGTIQHRGQEITSIREQNVHFGPTVSQEIGQVNPNVENSSRTKRKRKKKSKVWDDFTQYKGEDEKEWALCKHCNKRFVGSSKSGTTHLKNHLERCQRKRDMGGCSDHKSIDASDCLNTLVVGKKKSKVNQELNNLDETRMIIKYWSPLKPLKDDIRNVFEEEKEKLQRYFSKLPSRFNVTLESFDPESCLPFFDDHESSDPESWSSFLNEGVSFMVVHYIDNRWELKKRIIHVEELDYDLESVKSLLRNWNMDKNICCVYNDTVQDIEKRETEFINSWLDERGSFPVIGNCFIVSLLLKGIKQWCRPFISELRRCYANVHSSKPEVEKVPDAYEIPWFGLLECVVRYKEEFSQPKQISPRFQSVNFKEVNWDEATAIYECCKALKDIARNFSDRLASECLPFVCDVLLKLVEWGKSKNRYVQEIGIFSREHFKEYWSFSILALVITSILDPRYKMEIVKYACMEIRGNDEEMHLRTAIDAVKNIYHKYANATNNSESSISGRGDSTSATLLKKLHAEGRLRSSSQHFKDASPKSEFDRYLEDSKFKPDNVFNILDWWSFHSSTYPTLSRMARDFLSIPFSPSHKLLDSSLRSQITEILDTDDIEDDLQVALACTKLWLNYIENE